MNAKALVEKKAKVTTVIRYALLLLVVEPGVARADFQTSLQAMVNGILSGIFPVIILFELGKAGLAYARKLPDAKERAESAAIGAVAVLGINGVWSYLRTFIR